MVARQRRGLNDGPRAVAGPSITVALCLAARALAGLVPGGGGRAANDCLVELGVCDGRAVTGSPATCTACDPACDADGARDACRFHLALCVNQREATCSSTPLVRAVAKVKGKGLPLPPLDGTASCGSFTEVLVKARGRKPGRAVVTLRGVSKGRPRRTDKDRVVLVCKPRPASEPCPAPSPTCCCPGGPPAKLSFTTAVGAGKCGHLDADGASDFFSLGCGGLYFGGANVAVPLPALIPDMGTLLLDVTCSGTTLTLKATTPEATSIRTCTSMGCLFGPPIPLPDGNHGQAAASTCLINVVARDASGTADCATGVTQLLDLPLNADLYLDGDLFKNRCDGGSTPGAACATVGSPCAGGGTCANDTGRCRGGATPGRDCEADGDCGGGTCETGRCVGGSAPGVGCITDAGCQGDGARCDTMIQPCPICNAVTQKCQGGPNDGLDCTPGDSVINGSFPTSHDCPPPQDRKIGALAIAFALTSGTATSTASDFATQTHVFCGRCRKPAGGFKTVPCSGNNPDCSCASDADCADEGDFTACQQANAGAFTMLAAARTIAETGVPAGTLRTGGVPSPSTLVSVFCIPPSLNLLVDGASNLPGPGAVSLRGTMAAIP